jgi:nitrous oxidase accessory protein NosD
MIFANASARSGITFQRLTITGNRFENKATASIGYAIDLRRVQNSIIADNHVAGATSGIALSGELVANDVRGNIVDATEIAFRLDSSQGGNRAADNRILGSPRQPWITSNLEAIGCDCAMREPTPFAHRRL